MASEGSDNLQLAKLAEQTERYDDMVKFMTKVVINRFNEGSSLTMEERNLLSVAYKNKIGARRAAHRIIQNERNRASEASDETKERIAKALLEKIEGEMNEIYKAIIDLIDKHVIPKFSDEDAEAPEKVQEQVFYYKMKGDYCRYKAEFSTDDEKKKAADLSLAAYKKAAECADGLEKTHPVRLGLYLNFSVFHYEIMNDSKEACKLAKKAFDESIANLDKIQDEGYKDSALIMQLLRDNLTLWTTDEPKDDDEESQQE